MVKLTRKSGGEGSDNMKDPGPVHMPWEGALDALRSGEYDMAGNRKEDRGPDQPGAQTPAPGVDPVDGSKEQAREGDVLTNVTRTSTAGRISGGLPKAPNPPSEVREAPKMDEAAKPAGK